LSGRAARWISADENTSVDDEQDTNPALAMITFCLGFRHWHADHLIRSLRSLAPFKLPIIVVDAGGAELPIMTSGVNVHRIVTRMPEWSRSVALNKAVHLARTPYVCLTDADMIFPSHWIEIAQRHASPSRICLTPSRDLTDETLKTFLLVESLDEWGTPAMRDHMLARQSEPHPDVGQGAAMLVPRHWLLSVGGFDEQYQVWGCEDNDLVHRAEWDGLDVVWMRDTFVAHQWHRRDWPTPAQLAIVAANRAYFAARVQARGPIVRNQ
jgi:hypothetical protein